jgi:DNA-binding response OmpR family regulator
MAKILLVEDDHMMISLLTTLLKIEGYDVLPLEDDSEESILCAICSQAPDLVLMDVNLRHTNGLDVLRWVRQQEGCQGVRILMSSGMDYNKECIEAGADSFILKPYMPDDLIQQMQSLLQRKNDSVN